MCRLYNTELLRKSGIFNKILKQLYSYGLLILLYYFFYRKKKKKPRKYNKSTVTALGTVIK